MKTKIVLTLAEAHKVGESLQRDINILEGEIAEASRPVKANVQEDKFKAIAARTTVADSYKKLSVMVEASIALGEAIAKGNAEAGVDVLLKRRNLLTKHRSFLDNQVRQVKAHNDNAIDAEQAQPFFARMSAANSVNTVQIKVLDANGMTELKERQSEAVKSLDSINREISTLNHSSKITLNFKPSIMKILDC